jgi:uncharacterized membrane protein YfcA
VTIHLTVLAPLLFVAGLLVSMFSSVVGGGALIAIPLFAILGLPLPAAIATMRMSALVQQVANVGIFSKEKSIEWKSAVWVGVFSMPGAYFGAKSVLHINERLLSFIVVGCMLVLLFVLLKTDKKKLNLKTKAHKYKWPILAATGIVMGFYGGFYGAGFATVLMMVFSLVGGAKLLTASGNAAVAALLMGIPATYVFVRAGVVDWTIFWPFTVGGLIGSYIGIEEAAHFGLRWIEPLLIGVVCISVAKLILYP